MGTILDEDELWEQIEGLRAQQRELQKEMSSLTIEARLVKQSKHVKQIELEETDPEAPERSSLETDLENTKTRLKLINDQIRRTLFQIGRTRRDAGEKLEIVLQFIREWTWTLLNETDGASIGFESRFYHGFESLPDSGDIILFGGRAAGSETGSSENTVFNNDLWRSRDEGLTWTRVQAASTASPSFNQFERRGAFASAVRFNPTSEKYEIILTGGVGVHSQRFSDVWAWNNETNLWVRRLQSAPWGSRSSHSLVALENGYLVLFGGQSSADEPDPRLRDVWYSKNDGVTWEEINGMPWTNGRTNPGVTVRKNSSSGVEEIIVTGGYQTNPDAQGSRASRDVYAGIVSVDEATGDLAITWETRSTVPPQWSARSAHMLVATEHNHLILMGGWGGSSAPLNDIWVSLDGGFTWYEVPQSQWQGQNGVRATVTAQGMILFSGGGRSDGDDGSDDTGGEWDLTKQVWALRTPVSLSV